MSTTAAASTVRQLVGYDNFKRSNPKSDKFEIIGFHHVEFYCCDATNISRRFSYALGMPIVATSNLGSGNVFYSSTVIKSHSLCFVFTAPYGRSFTKIEGKEKALPPHPGYDQEQANNFIAGEVSLLPTCQPYQSVSFVITDFQMPDLNYSEAIRHQYSYHEQNYNEATKIISLQYDDLFMINTDHGLAVRAIAIRVADAEVAYSISTKNGAIGIFAPHTLIDHETGKSMVVSEIKMFGDVVIRWVSGEFIGPMLPNYHLNGNSPPQNITVGSNDSAVAHECLSVDADNNTKTLGILRLDHSVSNVPNLFDAVDYLTAAIGLHEFAEFCSADIGTLDSGLNSMVLASNNEMVLLPINEPTFGTKRQSQIQTFLDHNNGAGLQHLALLSKDIFYTVREMKRRGDEGCGFEFMKPPTSDYYAKVSERIGKNVLTAHQMIELQALGILADKDDQVRCLHHCVTSINPLDSLSLNSNLYPQIKNTIYCQHDFMINILTI